MQKTPAATVEIQAFRLTGQDPLAVRASKKLKNDELMVTSFAPTLLRMELDRVPLWRGDHVAAKQVVEDFVRYPYLPRLKSPAVLISAIQAGLPLMTWTKDSFAFADSFDETEGRYRGLRAMQLAPLGSDDLQGLLVRPEIAEKQLEAERPRPVPPPPTSSSDQGPPGPAGVDTGEEGKGPGNDKPPLKA